jgi:hypothetical protein
MITGIGEYIVEVGGAAKCVCLANFSLTPDTNNRVHFGMSYNTGISATRHADTTEKGWILTIEPADFDLSTLEILTATLATQQVPGAFVGKTEQYSSQIVYYNEDEPGELASAGANITTANSVVSSKLTLVDGRDNSEKTRSFRGLIYKDGEIGYLLEIKSMRRISSSTISVDSPTKLQFVVEEPVIRTINANPGASYTLLIAPLQPSYRSQSQVYIRGRLDLLPGIVLDLTTVTLTLEFPLSSTPVITLSPDSSGNFSAFFPLGTLAFPQTVEFSVSDQDVLYSQDVSTRSELLSAPTIGIVGGDFVESQIVVSGTALPGATVNLSSSLLGGLFNGVAVVANILGNWSISGYLSPLVTLGTNYSVSAASSSFSGTITANSTVTSNRIFNPILNYLWLTELAFRILYWL